MTVGVRVAAGGCARLGPSECTGIGWVGFGVPRLGCHKKSKVQLLFSGAVPDGNFVKAVLQLHNPEKTRWKSLFPTGKLALLACSSL